MTDTTDTTDLPTTLRVVTGTDADRLTALVSVYDELQTVLRCCERLLALLAAPEPDDLAVDTFWTTVLLCYGRAFGMDGVHDVDLAARPDDEARKRHRLLMHLRDDRASGSANPAATFTAGFVQDAAGDVSGVAVTSVPGHRVDAEAVRQTGAAVLALCELVDERIAAAQRDVFERVRALSRTERDASPVIEVAPG